MTAVAIECVLKREGGTAVTIDKIAYHFSPNKSGAHVCLVENKAHIARFLSIPEGYQLYLPDDAQTALAPVAPSPVAPSGTTAVVTLTTAGALAVDSETAPAAVSTDEQPPAVVDQVPPAPAQEERAPAPAPESNAARPAQQPAKPAPTSYSKQRNR